MLPERHLAISALNNISIKRLPILARRKIGSRTRVRQTVRGRAGLTLNPFIETLRRIWARQGIQRRSTATKENILALEKKYAVHLRAECYNVCELGMDDEHLIWILASRLSSTNEGGVPTVRNR